jgi:TonB family protein
MYGMEAAMVDLRRPDNLADFVRARRAFLQFRGSSSDRLVGGLLTLLLSVALMSTFAIWAINPPPAVEPPLMMAQLLDAKLPPPPKITLARHFIKVPVPEVPPPLFDIKTNAPLGTTAAPSTTRDPAYIESIGQHIREYFQPVADTHQGVVSVHFVIDRQGKFLFLGIAKSSGFPALDEAALAQMHRAEPLPAMPDKVDGDILYLLIPLCFKAGNAC